MISKEFQEWVENYYPTTVRGNILQAYETLQRNPHWLFPDIGNAEEVFRRVAKEGMVEYSPNAFPITHKTLYNVILKTAKQYAAQEVAKVISKYQVIDDENESLKQRVKELEEEQYVVSGNKSIQAKLDMFTNALIYIKNKGYDINDLTGNSLGYIAQQALMASNDVKEGQWGVREMECILCEKKWVAVFPIECTQLECPNCNKLNQIED
jgi:hypothetical protein